MGDTTINQNQIEGVIAGLERIFYGNLDPFFFFVASEITRLGSMPSVKLELPDGGEITDHPSLKNLQSSRSRISETQNSLMRMYRYFAAETMLVLILAGKPHDPAYRVTSVIKGRELNSIFENIADGCIPKKFSMLIKDKSPSFNEWLGQKVASNPEFFTHPGTASVGAFIQSEARFVARRGAINSFKHSRPVTHGPGVQIRLTPKGQTESLENILFSGVNWAEWKEGGNWFSIRHESEEVDTESDRRAIFYSCLTMDLMKRIRLHQLDGHEGEVTISVPCNFEEIPRVRRQNFTLKFAADGSESSTQ